jgi:hypothetical protein
VSHTAVLLGLLLGVSCMSLLLQGAALAVLLARKPSGEADRIARGGYIRTAACRVAAAAIYVSAAAAQLAGVRVWGDGLTPEALLILAAIQTVWLANAVLDLVTRRRLREAGRGQAVTTSGQP